MPSWLTTMLTVISQVVPVMTSVMQAWNSPTDTMTKLQTIAKDSPAEKALMQIGAELFPKLAPEFHAAAALLQVAHPTAIQYVQGGLNIIGAAGVFALPGGKQLAVDGLWGPKTRDAAEAAERAAGITLSGAPNDLLFNWIGGQLSKLG